MSPVRLLQSKGLVDVAGIEPATPCLQKQTAKLDAAEPSEAELEEEEGSTNSRICD